jgi:hypothetical protein
MQWIKQTFACRYNAMKRLDGHTWGDRYWSKVLAGELPEEEIAAKEAGRRDCVESGGEERAAGEGERIPKAHPREGPPDGDSHRDGKTAGKTCNPPHSPPRDAR